MVFVVQKPQSKKITNSSGSVDTQYSFRIETDQTATVPMEEGLSPATLLKKGLTASSVLTDLLEEFVRASRPYFTKQNTVAGILKVLHHTLTEVDPATTGSVGQYVFVPTELSILRGSFYLAWTVSKDTMLIDIPELDEQVATANSVVQGGLEVADLAALPSTETEDVLHLNTSRHLYDKRLVKEAHLRAKLAQYKAERKYTEYLEKYGAMPSDSEGSDSDSDSENSDSE